MKAKTFAFAVVHRVANLTLIPVFLALLLTIPGAVRGATRTWTGGYWSGYWSAPANWDTGPPQPGDNLVFPAGVSGADLLSTNNLGNQTYASITISGDGHVVRGIGSGATVTLTDGVSATAIGSVNRVELNIDLAASQTFECTWSNSELLMNGTIDLGNHTLTTLGAGQVHLGGVISGTGDITKSGSGRHWMEGSGANTYSGTTRVNSGTLELAKTGGDAIPSGGSLIIGNDTSPDDSVRVRERANFQIGAIPITINSDGWLDMDDYSDTVGAITFNGGHAGSSPAGILILGGNVTVNASSEEALFDGNLSLGRGTRTFTVADGSVGADLAIHAIISGDGLLKNGDGTMALHGANIHTGPTTVSQGRLYAFNDDAFGATSGGTIVGSSGFIQLTTGVDVGLEPLTLARTAGGSVMYASANCSWAGDVLLEQDARLGANVNRTLEFSGAISGPGGITMASGGTILLSGSTANSYGGETRLEYGRLLLNKSGGTAIAAGELFIGDNGPGTRLVRELADNQIATIPVTILRDGWLDVDAFSDTVGPITFNGGQAGSTTGLLGLGGDVTANASHEEATLIGRVYVGPGTRTFNVADGSTPYDLNCTAVLSGGGLLKIGDGVMTLRGANIHTGPTTVNQGMLDVWNDNAFGATGSGSSVTDSGSIRLQAVDVGLEPLTLGRTLAGAVINANGSCSWAGPVTIDSSTRLTMLQSTDVLEISGAIGGSGDVTMEGDGTVIYSGSTTNTCTGDTAVESGSLVLAKTSHNGAIAGDFYIGDGVGGADADAVVLRNLAQIADNKRITIATSGLFDMNNQAEQVGSLAGDGRIRMGTGDLVTGVDDSSTTYSGLIEGSGNLMKTGVGIFTLAGTNTYSGRTEIKAGTLRVNGSQQYSDVVVMEDGRLGGLGRVGEVENLGSVAPGASAGELSCATAALQAGSTFEIELDGYTPVDYDQLDVSGEVKLNEPDLTISWGFVPAVRDQFTIIDNDAVDAVTGTFNGLAEGARVDAGNVSLEISYRGGTGNDVVLTATKVDALVPLEITAIEVTGGLVELEWMGGVPLFVVQTKSALSNATWTAVTTPTRDFAVSLPVEGTNGFYRVMGGN